MIVIELTVALVGVAFGLCGAYLLVLAVAAFFYRQSVGPVVPKSRVTIVVPAHNEELLIGRTVRSLLAQNYPRELFQVAVIADNCDDRTDVAAAEAGADAVMVRDVPYARGKGWALRWAMDQILASGSPPDAIASVDADTIADSDMLLALVERLERGAVAVQSNYRAFGDGPSSELRQAGFLLMNHIRSAGRQALGMPSFLLGNGWLLSSELLRQRPWSAFTSTEDREYSLDLHSDGVGISYAGAAGVRAPTAPNQKAATTQQERWEGGWLTLVRARLPKVLAIAVRRRSPSLLSTAFDLAVPPLGLMAAGVLGGLIVSLAIVIAAGSPIWVAVPWLVAAAAVPLYVLIGLVAAGAPRSTYRALAHAPLFVLRKPLSLGRMLRFRADTWVRTERSSDGAEHEAANTGR